MEDRQLLQYIIDTSTVMLAKRQEATEYLAKLEAAQQSVQADGLPVLQCAECGEQTSMNHKESCSKRRR
jgi:ABC-type ATPase with predicted acetyltransferase domain